MKCLLKYQWVKLPRNQLLPGKGIMGAWARLASRAAFRNGKASYCGHINNVSAGSWVGGIVGLKSILGIKRRQKALEVMDCLEELEYISYSLDEKTKKLTYRVTDWVTNCSGEPCMGREAIYATEGYGFLCLPKNVTQRLVERHHQFGESDAWLDIWCHTVWKEPSNAFSHLAPAVQFGQYGAVLTLESLGRRWGWEKTKVWRFFRKHADAFPLYKLPGSFGCLILNAAYPTGERFSLPSQAQVERILNEIRKKGGNAHEKQASDHVRICKLVAWYSRAVLLQDRDLAAPAKSEESRVAYQDRYITRVYFSPCEILEYVKIITGTYSARLNYKIVYQTNLNNTQRVLADNLNSQQNYTLDASAAALGLASNEYVTQVTFLFGQVPAGFKQVETPYIYCDVLSGLAHEYRFANKCDVGGMWQNQWIQATDRWVTIIYRGGPTPTLPRTGY